MNKEQQNMIRAWLARACGVGIDRVTDHHVLLWAELNADIRAHRPTEAEARGVRALAKSLCVVPRDSGHAKVEPTPDHVKFFGPRTKLLGEA
jgi:hypothetical protein